ncbi:hypothetical protein M758_UG237200 [Ceratodon purpureus]|nr:hypothetical protein M758_UG237200 [Ceratodon purpureus]KAG0596253.1 hypothetical protein M758_UG237200 [Ceratodon purpureus]
MPAEVEDPERLSGDDSDHAGAISRVAMKTAVDHATSPTVTTAVPPKPASAMDVKNEVGKGVITETGNAGESSRQGEAIRRGSLTLDSAAVNALVTLRPNVTSSVELELARLNMARHDCGKPVSDLRRRLGEERERLRFFERKVFEKSGSYDKALLEFQRARDVLDAAKLDEGAQSTRELKAARRSFTRRCEVLVESWYENVAVTYTQLDPWEFKMKRQSDRVAKAISDLTAAKEILKEELQFLDTSLSELTALANALANL